MKGDVKIDLILLIFIFKLLSLRSDFRGLDEAIVEIKIFRELRRSFSSFYVIIEI